MKIQLQWTYILSQGIQAFVELLCKRQIMQDLLVLFYSLLENKEK